MKTMNVEQMENIGGAGFWHASICGVVCGIAIGGLICAAGIGGPGGVFVGACLCQYASNAFC